MSARKKGRHGLALAFIENVALGYERDTCLDWPYSRNHKGYGVLGHKHHFSTRQVNRVVCELAHGAPPTPEHQASHLCGNAPCVNPAHLAWKTPKDNAADKNVHGTAQRGERGTSTKLTAREARAIRELKGRIRQSELARIFEVHQSNISLIQSGRTWNEAS